MYRTTEIQILRTGETKRMRKESILTLELPKYNRTHGKHKANLALRIYGVKV
jgi:hypothetical protein